MTELNSQVSFKGYVPVYYFARNPKNNKFVPVLKKENIKKCQRFVVSNLNSTAKKNNNEEFKAFYKKHDPDYAKIPIVRSFYEQDKPFVYLFTGSDVDEINLLGKKIGTAKSEAMAKTGKSKSFESVNAVSQYYRNTKDYILRSCKRLKSQDNENLSLNVYFEPKYKKNNDLKGFEYYKSEFIASK